MTGAGGCLVKINAVFICPERLVYRSYIANAVLLKIGYKVGDKISHKVTSDALIVLARGKLKKELIEEYETVKEDALEIISSKADSLLESLDFEREKRSKFQYEMS